MTKKKRKTNTQFCWIYQLVFGSGIGNNPAPADPRGGENPKNFWRFVLILIEQRKYKNAIEQSVMSSPGNPLWLIFWTRRKGINGNLATTFPSKRLLRNPKTINNTTATTNPDLNLKRERSRVDSFKEVSTRSIFFVFDFLVSTDGTGSWVFIVSSFFEALSIVDLRDLYEVVRYIRRYEIASHTIAVQIEIPTSVKLSEYLVLEKNPAAAIVDRRENWSVNDDFQRSKRISQVLTRRERIMFFPFLFNLSVYFYLFNNHVLLKLYIGSIYILKISNSIFEYKHRKNCIK